MTTSTSAAAEVFWQGQQTGTTDLTQLTGSLSVDQGEAVQLQVLARWLASGEQLGGWKVGLTSGRSRDAFGAGVRPFGFILASRVFKSGDRIPRARIPKLGLETELCFRIGKRLTGARVGADEVRAAITSVAPAFEVNELRTSASADNGARAADNLSQWGLVVGAEIAPLPNYDFDALTVHLQENGVVMETVAAHGHIDDHFASQVALVHQLARFERALEPGQRVITGSYTRQNITNAGEYVGSFGELGTVSINFS